MSNFFLVFNLHHWWAVHLCAFVFNMKLLFWPMNLCFYHKLLINIPRTIFFDLLQSLSALLIAMTFTLLFIRRFRMLKMIYFIILFLVIFLLPLFTPISVCGLIVERYLYLPSIAFSFLIASLYISSVRKKKITMVIFAGICIFFCARTVIRNMDYHNEVIFWEKTVKSYPNHYMSLNNLEVDRWVEYNDWKKETDMDWI